MFTPKIIEVITEDKIFQKYAHKFFKPLEKYTDRIPDRIFNKFIKSATINDIAEYYIGIKATHPEYFINILR